MIQQTSLDAFFTLKGLNRKQQQVLSVIEECGPICNLEIASKLGKPINTVTPRTGELVAKGLVEEAYRAPSSTGRSAIHWRRA